MAEPPPTLPSCPSNCKDGVPGKDGRDGRDGMTVVGPSGLPGRNGLNGTDGQNGRDGIDGRDGRDGVKVNLNEKSNKKRINKFIASYRVSTVRNISTAHTQMFRFKQDMAQPHKCQQNKATNWNFLALSYCIGQYINYLLTERESEVFTRKSVQTEALSYRVIPRSIAIQQGFL